MLYNQSTIFTASEMITLRVSRDGDFYNVDAYDEDGNECDDLFNSGDCPIMMIKVVEDTCFAIVVLQDKPHAKTFEKQLQMLIGKPEQQEEANDSVVSFYNIDSSNFNSFIESLEIMKI